MRSILKVFILESKFFIMVVEYGCIVSKDVDIMVVFWVILLEVFLVLFVEYEVMYVI